MLFSPLPLSFVLLLLLSELAATTPMLARRYGCCAAARVGGAAFLTAGAAARSKNNSILRPPPSTTTRLLYAWRQQQPHRRRRNGRLRQDDDNNRDTNKAFSSSSQPSSTTSLTDKMDDLLENVLSSSQRRRPRAESSSPSSARASSDEKKENDDDDDDCSSDRLTGRQRSDGGDGNAAASSSSSSDNCGPGRGWKIVDWESVLQADDEASYCDRRSSTEFTAATATTEGTATTATATVVPPPVVDVVLVRNRVVHVKRDDQLRLPGSYVSGNKARKMYALNSWCMQQQQQQREMEEDGDSSTTSESDDGERAFPRCLVSYGGPQSNAMVALAAIARFRNGSVGDGAVVVGGRDDGNSDESSSTKCRFVYYTKTLPRFLRSQPSGNLFRAMALGMELIEVPPTEYSRMFGGDRGGSVDPPPFVDPPIPYESVWIPQGGACGMAYPGTRRLAREIIDYWMENGNGKPLSVCVPGGTCSTAALLHRGIRDVLCNISGSEDGAAKLDIEVVVIPCVGDEGYARRQMMSLNSQSGYPANDIPKILPPSPTSGKKTYFGQRGNADQREYYNFGEPHQDILATFQEMKEEHNIVLDLLYGSPAWTIMLRHWNEDSDAFSDREIMYVHSGGLEGISSQMLRYKYKNLVDLQAVQLPGRSKEKA